MRAVVDTNILVSGLLHAESLPAAVLRDIARQRLTPVVCDEIMAEYRAVLPRPHLRLHQEAIDELISLIEQMADRVAVPAYAGVPALPDPADWPFIACALALGCPVVTGNARHYPKRLGMAVMTAREWVENSRAAG